MHLWAARMCQLPDPCRIIPLPSSNSKASGLSYLKLCSQVGQKKFIDEKLLGWSVPQHARSARIDYSITGFEWSQAWIRTLTGKTTFAKTLGISPQQCQHMYNGNYAHFCLPSLSPCLASAKSNMTEPSLFEERQELSTCSRHIFWYGNSHQNWLTRVQLWQQTLMSWKGRSSDKQIEERLLIYPL